MSRVVYLTMHIVIVLSGVDLKEHNNKNVLCFTQDNIQ